MIRYLLTLTLPLYLLDQITKWMILANFPSPDEGYRPPISIIPGFFNIVRVHNTGMAFGRFNNFEYSNVIFGAIAAVALVAIITLWRKGAFFSKISKVAAALLMSGILGNVTDRVLHGYVVDFLDFYRGGYHFPSFNVADSCITVAAVFLFVSAFQKPPETNSESPPAPD
ncbi:MAG: signal peptidase II [Verrucomicrobiota bacterium]